MINYRWVGAIYCETNHSNFTIYKEITGSLNISIFFLNMTVFMYKYEKRNKKRKEKAKWLLYHLRCPTINIQVLAGMAVIELTTICAIFLVFLFIYSFIFWFIFLHFRFFKIYYIVPLPIFFIVCYIHLHFDKLLLIHICHWFYARFLFYSHIFSYYVYVMNS